MNTKLNIGDVVCLNHSDILLTIIEDELETGKKGYYKVAWFNEDGDFKTVVVPGEVLRKENKETFMNASAS